MGSHLPPRPPTARGPSLPRPRPFPSLSLSLPPRPSPLSVGRTGVLGPCGRAHPLPAFARGEDPGWSRPRSAPRLPCSLDRLFCSVSRSLFQSSGRLGAQHRALRSLELGKLQTTPRAFPARRGPPSPALAARLPVLSPPASSGGGAALLLPPLHPLPYPPRHRPRGCPRLATFFPVFWNIRDVLREMLTQNTGSQPGRREWGKFHKLKKAFLANFYEELF